MFADDVNDNNDNDDDNDDDDDDNNDNDDDNDDDDGDDQAFAFPNMSWGDILTIHQTRNIIFQVCSRRRRRRRCHCQTRLTCVPTPCRPTSLEIR